MTDTPAQFAAPISDYAIIVNPDDNVAVVKNETHTGLVLALPGDGSVKLSADVPPGHRFATRDIPAGEFVKQYGQPIGTSMGIASGDWISHDNMTDEVPVVRDISETLVNPPPDYFAEDETD